jgi:hypothetical protein
MSDFFERLVARSAGRPGLQPRVRPRLAHPFERAAPPEFDAVLGEAPASPPSPGTPAGPVTAHQAPGVVEHHTETVRREQELRHATMVERSATTVDTSVREVVERIETTSPPLLVPVVRPGPAGVPGEPGPAGEAGAPAPAPRVAAATKAIAAAGARPRRAAAAAPGRADPEPDRVVHVSIGRLEVKAAAAAPARDRRPARLAPAVPLADYLAREGS